MKNRFSVNISHFHFVHHFWFLLNFFQMSYIFHNAMLSQQQRDMFHVSDGFVWRERLALLSIRNHFWAAVLPFLLFITSLFLSLEFVFQLHCKFQIYIFAHYINSFIHLWSNLIILLSFDMLAFCFPTIYIIIYGPLYQTSQMIELSFLLVSRCLCGIYQNKPHFVHQITTLGLALFRIQISH